MDKILLHIDNIKDHVKKIENASAVKLKHSQILNQASKTLGFSDYQTLKGISDKNYGYIEMPISDFQNTFISQRFRELEWIKSKLLENFIIEEISDSKHFQEKALELLNITVESFKVFYFLKFINFEDLHYGMCLNRVMYFLFLSIRFNRNELEKEIVHFFNLEDNKNRLFLYQKEINTSEYPIFTYNAFVSKFEPFLKDEELLIQIAYSQQLWTSRFELLRKLDNI